MKIILFAGPTLTVEDARRALDPGDASLDIRPPAVQGDVYRAAQENPAVLAVVDGHFDQIAPIAHKEILWALSQGVHVYGSSSMGALRAAELAPFGMVGVGAVYDAILRGDLEDDDEVAVAHASAEEGYRAAGEAMVNIRATLAAAGAAGVLGDEARRTLTRVAKALFYPDRCYPVLLERAAGEGVAAAEIAALRAFLGHGRVDQKRADALEMLRLLAARRAALSEPFRARFPFQHTDAWEAIRRKADGGGAIAGPRAPAP